MPIAALAAWLNPLVVFAVAAALLTLLNIACSNWIQRQSDSWIAGNAERLEARLDKLRKGRIMRHPMAWITRGSSGWYALAAALINAITVSALARLIGGERVSERRIRRGALAYSIFFAAVYSFTGYLFSLALA